MGQRGVGPKEGLSLEPGSPEAKVVLLDPVEKGRLWIPKAMQFEPCFFLSLGALYFLSQRPINTFRVLYIVACPVLSSFMHMQRINNNN